jgi:hypothetical protein
LTDRALSHLLKLRQERAAAAGGQDQQMVFRVRLTAPAWCPRQIVPVLNQVM